MEGPDPELAARVERQVAAWRAGEDPDLEQLLRTLWSALYARIPRLTTSRGKDEQHRVLAEHLEALGFPRSPDLQYIAGPVLWYAREKGVIPPARADAGPAEPWTLDEERYEKARATLDEGRTAYGDWMRDALRQLLAEQQ